MAQGAIDTRRRHLKAVVRDTVHFQGELQLAIDFFAVFYGDKYIGSGLPRPVDRDAQQTARRALNLNQVIAQAGHGFLNNLLQCHRASGYRR